MLSSRIAKQPQPRRLDVVVERWTMTEPIVIAGHRILDPEPIVVTVTEAGRSGRGEALGVYYHGDTAGRLASRVESVRQEIEAGAGREELQRLLPAGGARNALDCALWDLDAKLLGESVYEMAGVARRGSLPTTYTLSAGAPEAMSTKASDAYRDAVAIKVKLLGDGLDGARLAAVRAARPDVWLGVDANQSYSRALLIESMPTFVDLGVQLVEQPCRVGEEDQLDGIQWPIPLAADESVQSLADIDPLVGRFGVVNIKLDKCGGLTEGLHMARRAQALGLGVMVGNMGGTSLGMAPGLVLGQMCDLVDLDGPLFLEEDREHGIVYDAGYVSAPRALWGWPA
jgi:L-alanine-DL-glutamate epimerase-like enolase superfamily enzyme